MTLKRVSKTIKKRAYNNGSGTQNSSFTFWKDGDTFYYSDNPNSEKVELGTLEDVNEFLEQFAE